MIGTNCVRLSNDASFLKENSASNKSNMYGDMFLDKKNIFRFPIHNISKSEKSAIILIYDNRNGMLFMNNDVIASIRRLDEIKELPYDWNGYGAAPFSSELIDKCKKIINILLPQPQIYPTGRQSIQFQYELKDKSYLEFEIFEHKTMCLFVPKRIYTEAEEIEITDAEEKRIKEMVEKFYGNSSTERRNII